MARQKTIPCPRECGNMLKLEPHPTEENRVIAKCDCKGALVPVYKGWAYKRASKSSVTPKTEEVETKEGES